MSVHEELATGVQFNINPCEARKHGITKACILGNLWRFKETPRENLHLEFSFIPKDEFFSALNELLKDGLVEEIQS
jgi:hypothetical protein